MTIQKIVLTLFLFSTINLYAQSTKEINSEALTKILYQYTNDDLPGMAVGIVQDGKIVYEKYVGYAEFTHKVKVDQDTRFNIASNAKQFTALCILKLIDEGKLKLGDDIRMYFPDLYKDIEDKITISNLLTHTSGIRDYCDLMALTGKTWWKQFIDNGDAMELLEGQRDLNFRPGTAYTYSNSNYILLAELVEKITKQDFNEYAIAMFESLEMPNSSFFTHYGAIIPNRARPYGNWGVWREEPTITEVHGDGALYTTLRDQLQWEKIVQENDGKYFSKKFINESQLPLESSIEDGYGYGLFFERYNGLDYVFHDGVTSAFNNTFLRFPDQNISIVVMSNNRNVIANNVAWQIAFQVMGLGKAIYPGNPSKVEPLASIQDVLGIYKNDDGTMISITEKDGAIYREMDQRKPVKLINEQGALFEYETIKGLKMNFTNIGKAGQKFTLYMSSQRPGTYHKVSDLNSYNMDKQELNGSFYNDETGTEILIQFVDNNTYTITKNGREREAELIFKDCLKMNSYEIYIRRDAANNVIGLSVDNKRISNVIFEKS